MPENQDLQALLSRLRQGDEDAATELVRRYEPQVRRFVHYRLTDRRLRRFVDSLDVCQSVFANLLFRLLDGSYDIDDPRQLAQLLLTMANNKILDHRRRQTAACRGGWEAESRQQELADTIAAPFVDPLKAIADRELVDNVRQRLTTEEQGWLDLWMNGDDWEGLAAANSCSPDAMRKRFGRAIDRAVDELGWKTSTS